MTRDIALIALYAIAGACILWVMYTVPAPATDIEYHPPISAYQGEPCMSRKTQAVVGRCDILMDVYFENEDRS